MAFDLPADLSASIQDFIAFEGYKSEEAVLRDALAALKHRANVAAIQKGVDDMEAGRFRDWKDAKAELRAKLGIEKS
jgi:predicted transcriptional regulator